LENNHILYQKFWDLLASPISSLISKIKMMLFFGGLDGILYGHFFLLMTLLEKLLLNIGL